jgi:hypothetical protein
MPIPINAAGSSSAGADRSGKLEMKLGDAASPPPLLCVPLAPPEVDGRPSAVDAAGTDRIGGVHSPTLGSRDGASGEKLNLRVRGAGTLARVNLAGDSLFAGVVWDGSDVGGGSAEPTASPAGDANDQVVESGVGGPIMPGVGPKSKLKPVSTTGFGRARSEVSSVGAGLGWLRSRFQLGWRIWGVLVREGGELCEL